MLVGMSPSLTTAAAGLTASSDAFAQRAEEVVRTLTEGPDASTKETAPVESLMVGLLSEAIAFDANAALVKAADEQIGILLDMMV